MKNYWMQKHNDCISLQKLAECDLHRYYEYQYVQNEKPSIISTYPLPCQGGLTKFSLKHKHVLSGTLAGTLYVDNKPLAVLMENGDGCLSFDYQNNSHDFLSGKTDVEKGAFEININASFQSCYCVVNYEYDHAKDGELP